MFGSAVALLLISFHFYFFFRYICVFVTSFQRHNYSNGFHADNRIVVPPFFLSRCLLGLSVLVLFRLIVRIWVWDSVRVRELCTDVMLRFWHAYLSGCINIRYSRYVADSLKMMIYSIFIRNDTLNFPEN